MNYILALGIGDISEGKYEAVTKASYSLRGLIDKAIGTNELFLSKGLRVSIGPKLSVMLTYLNEPTAERVLQLAEAVQSILSGALEAGEPCWPVAGVITRGEMTSVLVFDEDWNFEGRAAIAAARILARLEAGALAVEEQAWTPELNQFLTTERTITGKRSDEEYKVRIHSRIFFTDKPVFPRRKPDQSPSPPAGQARITPPPDATARVGAYICQRLEIEAFAENAQTPLVIHERHDLLVPPSSDEVIIPLAICVPRDRSQTTDVRISGLPQVFDGSGPVRTSVIAPSALGGAICVAVRLTPKKRRCQCLIEIFYQPEALNGRIFIRMPAMAGHQVQQARLVVWGAADQLSREVKAFSIGTGGVDRGRHPIIAICSDVNIETKPCARVFYINQFDPNYEHEISWPGNRSG